MPTADPTSNLAHEVLAFEAASFEMDSSFDTALADVSFVLRAGELLMVRLEREFVKLPLADAASGLVMPVSGAVRFQGQNWGKMSPGISCRARGQIGRVFEGPNWVSNLDVDENVILAQRHHTHCTDADLHEEAHRLAQDMGLPGGLPKGRPASARRLDLARSAVVRALMGHPALILLERPEAGVNPEIMPALVKVLTDARQRGSAVLWLTNYYDVWSEKSIQPTRRGIVNGSQLRLIEDE